MAIDGAGILVMDSGAGGSFRPGPGRGGGNYWTLSEKALMSLPNASTARIHCTPLSWVVFLLRGGLCSPMIMQAHTFFRVW